MSTLSQPLGQVLTPKKSNLAPALLLILGLIVALSAATYGYIESRRTEKVIIAVRAVPYGQQFTADDLGTIELPLHRPVQLAGIRDPNQVIGTWAAREIGPNDLVQPTMLLATAPDQPVYPSGQKLDKDTVPVPFSTETIGAQLGVRKLAAAGQVTIAIAGAKGGIGKTLVVAMLAEGLKRRGLKVLVVDGDLSNSGIVPTFRIPSGFPSYLYLKQDGLGAFTPANVRRHIYAHDPSGIHFLLGSEETANPMDLNLGEWQAMMQAVRAIEGYDVVLIDTGPEIKKRPYAIDTARSGGFVVLPTPPGRKERAGVGNALRVFEQHTPDLTDRCLLLYMEPEKGVTVSVDRVAPLFAQTWPRAQAIGVLPRAPRQVSMADEEGDRYLSPLDVAPHSTFTRAVHHIVQSLCGQTGLTPALPMPKSSLWQRFRGEQIMTVSAALPAVVAAEVRA